MKESVETPIRTATEMQHDSAASAASMKSKGGLPRILSATRYSILGIKAAWQHEAAFRQEIGIGIALLIMIPWLAPSLLHGMLMFASILLVWCVEMINSAVEALADAISNQPHPLLGRAKDMGSAAVMFSLLLVLTVWSVSIYTKFCT